MDKKFKQQLGLIAFGVALFTALNNLNYISDFLHVCAELLTPVFAGLLMAFILSVPMRGIGKRLSRLMPKASERTINVLSLIITLLLLVAIIVLLCVIAIPQLIASVKSIISLIKEMCRGADTWYADFPFVFYIPDPLCRADGGFDRSFCLCTIHWSVLVLCNRYVADFAG